ncbi:MAG: TetR/AcrR family transcriptional regulator [Rhizobiales bacterium]|nr:TetR/AcrR family transcriptional regulator [Hyphomicrobiales bacterium]
MDERPARADARRNQHALLDAAMEVFATAGVDAPIRDIAERAGVGVGTLYRHFPKRSDLIAAVFRKEVDACAAAAATIAAQYEPGDALERWLDRFIGFVAAKRGLSAALHSGDPAFEPLPAYLVTHHAPAAAGLLAAAAEAGRVRSDVKPADLLMAIAHLCAPDGKGGITAESRRMVSLLVDGLRYGATRQG